MKQHKDTVRYIMGIIETGQEGGGNPGYLVTLEDHAGITYGMNQTTENGGGLWKLLFEHYRGPTDFSPYKDRLYQKGVSGTKSSLTDDDDFKEMLRKAGDEPEMKRAQIAMFDTEYMEPALGLIDTYALTLPYALLIMYDLCIHAGPTGAEHFIDAYEAQGQDTGYESKWLYGLVQYRDDFLRTYTHKDAGRQRAVRMSQYRTASYIDLYDRRGCTLELPFPFVLKRSVVGYKDTVFEITQEKIRQVFGV